MNSRRFIPVVMLCAAIIAACATTEVKSVWKDETYQAQPKRILVISMFKDQTARRMAEDEFKNHLKYRGVDAATRLSDIPRERAPVQGNGRRAGQGRRLRRGPADAAYRYPDRTTDRSWNLHLCSASTMAHPCAGTMARGTRRSALPATGRRQLCSGRIEPL